MLRAWHRNHGSSILRASSNASRGCVLAIAATRFRCWVPTFMYLGKRRRPLPGVQRVHAGIVVPRQPVPRADFIHRCTHFQIAEFLDPQVRDSGTSNAFSTRPVTYRFRVRLPRSSGCSMNRSLPSQDDSSKKQPRKTGNQPPGYSRNTSSLRDRSGESQRPVIASP